MITSVKDIYNQKLQEIQDRLPVKLKTSQDTVSFNQYLNDAQNAANASENTTNHSSDVSRAQISKASSKAFIPSDKSQLMNIIDSNIQMTSAKYGVDPN
ncbi:MAG TPA: lytic transglycosylase domain-containing protein, partial [Clostridia bacterium]